MLNFDFAILLQCSPIIVLRIIIFIMGARMTMIDIVVAMQEKHNGKLNALHDWAAAPLGLRAIAQQRLNSSIYCYCSDHIAVFEIHKTSKS